MLDQAAMDATAELNDQYADADLVTRPVDEEQVRAAALRCKHTARTLSPRGFCQPACPVRDGSRASDAHRVLAEQLCRLRVRFLSTRFCSLILVSVCGCGWQVINSTGSMGETMRRHVAERGRKAMEKEGGVTTDDLKNDMKRLMSLMDTSEEVAEAQKQVRQTARSMLTIS